MKKYIQVLIPIGLFLIFLIKVIIPQFSINTECVKYDEFLLMSFNGVILQKYIDSTQHSYKTIVIKNFGNTKPQELLLDFDRTNTYNMLKIHDTIYKEIHNDSLFIVRNNQKRLLSKIDFGCAR
jgi:hypothetical protein